MRESQARVSIIRLRLKKDGRKGGGSCVTIKIVVIPVHRKTLEVIPFVSFSHYFNARLEQLSPPRFYSYILESLHVTFTLCHLRGRESWSSESTRRNYSLSVPIPYLLPPKENANANYTILSVAKWESLSLQANESCQLWTWLLFS